MYIFAEPVTEEQADEIQNAGEAVQKEFARRVVGVGQNDPEVQEAWQNIQDEVDGQINEENGSKHEDQNTQESLAESEDTVEGVKDNGGEHQDPVSGASNSESKDAAENAEETSSDSRTSQKLAAEDAEPIEAIPDEPLIGWTLTVRNKVNGQYVQRPMGFTKDDDWIVEYHIQEIPETSKWRLYKALKDRRKSLIGVDSQQQDAGLKRYRDMIQRISNKGRKWREEQDKINEELGTQMFRPMGPGSESIDSVTDAPTNAAIDAAVDEAVEAVIKAEKQEEASSTETTPEKSKLGSD